MHWDRLAEVQLNIIQMVPKEPREVLQSALTAWGDLRETYMQTVADIMALENLADEEEEKEGHG